MMVGLVTIVISLASCTGAAGLPPEIASHRAMVTPTESLVVGADHATPVGTAADHEATPTTCTVTDPLPGGGEINDGPFTFCATLYRDPALKLPGEASAAWFTTDVPGVGARLLYQYHGPPETEPVRISWGPEGQLQEIGRSQSLQPGAHGGRDYGGLLVAGAGAGDQTWYGMRIATPSGTYGVKIEFSLVRGPAGLEIRNVGVAPLAP